MHYLNDKCKECRFYRNNNTCIAKFLICENNSLYIKKVIGKGGVLMKKCFRLDIMLGIIKSEKDRKVNEIIRLLKELIRLAKIG